MYLLLAGKDTVSILVCGCGRLRSTECPLLTTALKRVKHTNTRILTCLAYYLSVARIVWCVCSMIYSSYSPAVGRRSDGALVVNNLRQSL